MTRKATATISTVMLRALIRHALMAQRWAELKRRAMDLKGEREECGVRTFGGGSCRQRLVPGWTQDQAPPPLPFADYCPPCQRNEARYRLRQLFQRKLRDAGRRMVEALA